VNDRWTEEARQIYRDYTIYFQSNGKEQAVFDSKTGSPKFRSDLIMERICEQVKLSGKGSWLDIGCGNGSFLRAAGRQIPQWQLSGFEINDKYKKEIENIKGVDHLYTGDTKDIPATFKAISLIHVLEHIPSPQKVLQQLHGKLEDGGHLIVEVPDCSRNPFMLLVADHCSHFSVEIAAALVRSSGYEVLHAVSDWVPKEITIVAQKVGGKLNALKPSFPSAPSRNIFSHGKWLPKILNKARACKGPNFGIFGTSIAGTWLFSELDGKIDFFVDEDPNRSNRDYLGKPILRPAQLPKEANVFMALPSALAKSISQRLSRPGLNCHLVD
jgi:2-polyprenyl-3-methyl-5-hydroxy-6-metoxy-1,4-benzoquinol methylase